jgi:hypothetical protein
LAGETQTTGPEETLLSSLAHRKVSIAKYNQPMTLLNFKSILLALGGWPDMHEIKKHREKSRNSLASNIKALLSPQTFFDLMQVLFQKKEKEIHP